MGIKKATIIALLMATPAMAKVPICVSAVQLQTHDADGFVIEGVEKQQKGLNDSAKDLTKQVGKRKALTTQCESPTALKVYFRGRVPDGTVSVDYNPIGNYYSIHKGRTMMLCARLELEDGRSKGFCKVFVPGLGMPSWGGLAKGLSKDIEKFVKANLE
jgi:hypothetical protein